MSNKLAEFAFKIGFQTNGIALTEKKWNSLPEIVRSRCAHVGISIDGATAPTYERLRLGGKFESLMKNISYLATMPDKKKYGFPFNLNMIVQVQNYQEIVKLVDLGKAYGVDNVSFTYIRDWGTSPQGEYERQAVHLPSHPEHGKLRELLTNPFCTPLMSIWAISLTWRNRLLPGLSGADATECFQTTK